MELLGVCEAGPRPRLQLGERIACLTFLGPLACGFALDVKLRWLWVLFDAVRAERPNSGFRRRQEAKKRSFLVRYLTLSTKKH